MTALVIFIATYLFLVGRSCRFLKLDRPGGAVAGAVAMVALGVLTPQQVYRDAVNWDTLVLLLGMMVMTSVMARAGVFRWISWAALRHAHGPRTAPRGRRRRPPEWPAVPGQRHHLRDVH